MPLCWQLSTSVVLWPCPCVVLQKALSSGEDDLDGSEKEYVESKRTFKNYIVIEMQYGKMYLLLHLV